MRRHCSVREAELILNYHHVICESARMPYRDREQQRAYMREWRAAHPERLRCYRRAEVLHSALQTGRLPSARVAERHEFTQDELRPVVGRMLALYGLDHLM